MISPLYVPSRIAVESLRTSALQRRGIIIIGGVVQRGIIIVGG